MGKTGEDINFHLYHIAKLEMSGNLEELRECIKHCEAVFHMTDEGCATRAFRALELARKVSLVQPEWATSFFDNLVNVTMDFPEVVFQDRKKNDEIRAIRRKRDACNYAVVLLDRGVLSSSKYNNARQLLKDLNRYWVNGGEEGTEQTPLVI